MIDFWNKYLKRPRGALLVAVYAVTALFIGLAISMLFIDYTGGPLEIAAYVSYALAALTLGYSVYTVVVYAPGLRGRIIALIDKYEFTRRLVKNFGFRTIVTAVGTFVISVVYAIFNAFLGISSGSIWFGALAAYYIMLALIRGGILLYHKSKRNGGQESEELIRAKAYRNSGVILLVLNTALSSAIAQMIFDDRAFSYSGWIIYAFAAYAFFKITMSIINAFKAKNEDMTVKAIRHINLVDAAVSILALQTALLHTFADAAENLPISLFNTLTGSAVSVFSVSLSIYMIVKARKIIKTVSADGK